MVSYLLRDNRKYCGITSRWVYIPPPYKILFLNSRPRQNKVGIVEIVDPRTIVCERPDPPTTPNPKRVSILFLVVMQKTTVHHVYILAPLHSSQTPHLPSFFTLPVERLEGKQRCSRAPVGEHAELLPENSQSDGSRRNERSIQNNQTHNSPSHNHDSTAPRQHPLICTGVGPIHPVHGQPMSLATKAIPRNEVTFPPFYWAQQAFTR